MPSLEERSAAFAAEIQATLDGVLPGDRRMISVRAEQSTRYIVVPESDPSERRIPLFVSSEALADLGLSFHLDLDRSGHFLKTVRSDIFIRSVLDRTPLVRYEYRADMHTDPIAHWQVHAERGAIAHLLSRAHAHRPEQVKKPHDMSSIHFPVGGERFRPCLEDILQFLVVDCGIDHQEGWHEVVSAGRKAWRLRQLGSTVRDLPEQAAATLTELGWTVTPPERWVVAKKPETLTTW